MQPKELTDLVKRLRNAYGLKQVDAEIVDFIFSKCGTIPSKAIEFIEDRFQTLYDKFPTKLHAAILSCWWEYLREHPKDKAKEYHACPYCEDGMLRLGKRVEMYGGVMTEFAANCGHCRQREDEKSVPMLTIQQAKAMGYTLWDENKKQEMVDYSKTSWWHDLVPSAGRHETLPPQPDTQPEKEMPF